MKIFFKKLAVGIRAEVAYAVASLGSDQGGGREEVRGAQMLAHSGLMHFLTRCR